MWSVIREAEEDCRGDGEFLVQPPLSAGADEDFVLRLATAGGGGFVDVFALRADAQAAINERFADARDELPFGRPLARETFSHTKFAP